MLIIDFNQTLISALMAQLGANPNTEVNENLVRHLVLSTILMHKKKFSGYGEVVLACDDKHYWRKRLFPYYKGKRKDNREKSGFDWNAIFKALNKIRDEIKVHFPYKVIQVESAEADDIVAVLCKYTQTNDYVKKGLFEIPRPVMIVSGDKDFAQLQKYSNIKQYSPMQKKMITVDDPNKFLLEHVIRGDVSDGVPNFLSDDDVFMVEGKKQKSIMSKKVDIWLNQTKEEICENDAKLMKNYERNLALIDLSKIPEDVESKIIEAYISQKPSRRKLLQYFVQNKLKYLFESIQEF